MNIYVMMIAIAVITGSIVLAKRGRGKRRNFSGYTRGNIRARIELGTLAAATGKVEPMAVVDRPTRISSVKAMYSLSGWTEIDNVGPISIGIAHGDYSLAEIEEWIEQTETASWLSSDLIAKEVSGRLVRRIGVFRGANQSLGAAVLNNGKPLSTKLNWRLAAGETVQYWVYNLGSAAVATTDPQVEIDGQANLWTA